MAAVAPPPVMDPIAASQPFGPPPPAYPSGLDPAVSSLAARIAAIRGAGLQGAGPLWTPQAPAAPVNPVPDVGGGAQPAPYAGPPPGLSFMQRLLYQAAHSKFMNGMATPLADARGWSAGWGARPGMPAAPAAPVVPQVMPNPQPAGFAVGEPAPGGGMGGPTPTPSVQPSGGFMGAFDPAGGNPFLQRGTPKGPGY